jgi:hypothetical protein
MTKPPRISSKPKAGSRYLVEGFVSGWGRRKHYIRARRPKAAWERFCAAYSRNVCTHVSSEKMKEE